MMRMAQYIVVVPNALYTWWESTNARGCPAVHAVLRTNPTRTLCGKNPEYWDYYEDAESLGDVNCQACKRLMERAATKEE